MDMEDQLEDMERATEELELDACQGDAELVKMCKHHRAVMM